MCMFQNKQYPKPLNRTRKGFKVIRINENGMPTAPIRDFDYELGTVNKAYFTRYNILKGKYEKSFEHDEDSNPGFNVFEKLKDAHNYFAYRNNEAVVVPVTARIITSTSGDCRDKGFCAMELTVSKSDWVKAICAKDKNSPVWDKTQYYDSYRRTLATFKKRAAKKSAKK